jgi:hypothetical protein
MKRLYMAAAILLASGGLALGQGVGAATGPVGSETTGPTNPNASAPPGITLAPSVGGTVGLGRSADLGGPQDFANRGNPRALTRSGPGNPQDSTQ